MASRRFEEAFDDGIGTNRMECSCGVTHFCNEDRDYMEGEYRRLTDNLMAYPDRYRMRNGNIESITIDGTVFVMGCDCDYPNKCEKFILNNAKSIAQYLNSMAGDLENEARNIRVDKLFRFLVNNPNWKFYNEKETEEAIDKIVIT